MATVGSTLRVSVPVPGHDSEQPGRAGALPEESERVVAGLIVRQDQNGQARGAGREIGGDEPLLLGRIDAAPGAEPVQGHDMNTGQVS
jgi:hypothetical protein